MKAMVVKIVVYLPHTTSHLLLIILTLTITLVIKVKVVVLKKYHRGKYQSLL